MKLKYDKTGNDVVIGDTVETSNDDVFTVEGMREPHKPSSTGRVFVKDEHGRDREFFPNVIGASWHDDPDKSEPEPEEKEQRQYTVITSAGYWGKGNTAVEAAQNAMVNNTYVFGIVFHADPDLVNGEVECSGMGGGQYRLTKLGMELEEKYPRILGILQKTHITKATGKLRVRKGKLECLSEID